MKTFLLRLLLFLIPFPFYIGIVLLIDPYNYLDISNFISQEAKEDTSLKIFPQLWNLIEYKKFKSPVIILGDSRAGKIRVENLKKVTNIDAYNFAYEGGSLIEIIETFWIANEIQKFDEVYIGLNFNLYNDFERRNRVEQAESIMKNIFTYSFNKIVFWSMIENVKREFFVKSYKVGVPNMSYDQLWDYEINVISKRFYSKYKYPEEYYKKLKTITDYCKKNDIKLVFFTPPTHTDLQQRIKDFDLEEENNRFLNDVSELGQFYNLDIESDFTKNRENFVDPYHAWTDSFVIHKIWNSMNYK